MLSLFDQFEVVRLLSVEIAGIDFVITNLLLFLLIPLFLYRTLISTAFNVTPGRWHSALLIFNGVVKDIVKENIGKNGMAYFPFIKMLFVFIVLINLIGIIPYTFTPTALMQITLGLSVSIFLGCLFISLVKYKSLFFSTFLPSGSPMYLAPFLVIVEFISYTAKAFSLGVRLAANITAGHLLFAILAQFAWDMFIAGGFMTIGSIFPLLIIYFITILELVVALIQAYVFCLLTSIYIHDAIELH